MRVDYAEGVFPCGMDGAVNDEASSIDSEGSWTENIAVQIDLDQIGRSDLVVSKSHWVNKEVTEVVPFVKTVFSVS